MARALVSPRRLTAAALAAAALTATALFQPAATWAQEATEREQATRARPSREGVARPAPTPLATPTPTPGPRRPPDPDALPTLPVSLPAENDNEEAATPADPVEETEAAPDDEATAADEEEAVPVDEGRALPDPGAGDGPAPGLASCQFADGEPAILAYEVSTSDQGTLLARHPIYYVVGGSLDVTLAVPACATITRVTREDVELPLFVPADPIEGIDEGCLACILSDVVDENVRRVSVRLPLSNHGQGHSYRFQVTVQNTANDGAHAATFDLIAVDVKTVNGDVYMSISEAEYRNQVILTILSKYRAGDYCVDEHGQQVDCSDPAVAQRMYAPSFSPRLEIEPDGITFAWSTRVRTGLPDDFDCDPTVHVAGVFRPRIVESDTGRAMIQLDWVAGPNVDADFASTCGGVATDFTAEVAMAVWDALAYIPGIGDSPIERAEDGTADSVQQDVDAALRSHDCLIGPCLEFVNEIQTAPNELRLRLDTTRDPITGEQYDHVSIDVPYRAPNPGLPIAPAVRPALALGPTSSTGIPVVVASGLASVCDNDLHGLAPDCALLPSGPNGMPNAGFHLTRSCTPGEEPDYVYPGDDPDDPASPVCFLDDPNLPDNGLYGPTLEAYASLEAARRSPELLPVPGPGVGELIARIGRASTTPGTVYIGGARVLFPLDLGSPLYLELGVNDHGMQPVGFNGTPLSWSGPGHEHGSGAFTATILFY